MAIIFDTTTLDEKVMSTLDDNVASWVYNGLDCCITADIYRELSSQLSIEEPCVKETHATMLRKHAPYLEMNIRGVKVDLAARDRAIRETEKTLNDLDKKFQRIMVEVFGGKLNWDSHIQVKGLFYSTLKLKEIKKRNSKGIYASTVDEEALNQLKAYPHARLLCNFILHLRSLRKSIGFLKTQIDPDLRMRTAYNLAGTNTGRLSSAENEFGTGTNLQNVDRSLRYPFVADEKKILVNIDLGQADSRNLGASLWQIFYETYGAEEAGRYLDACESNDLHTTVCRMCWPKLDWPEEISTWKKFCDALILYGQDSYRQGSKKLGHGTNFLGKPPHMAKQTHVAQHVIEDFQRKYFRAFPLIPEWHNWTIEEIKTKGKLYNLFGRRRFFFDRPDAAATHRAAIAYVPQSSTGEEIDRGIIQLYEKFDHRHVELLLQVHDSILFQVPYDEHKQLIPEVLKTLEVHKELKGGRDFCVPLDAETGYNWGKADPDKGKNLRGLKGFRDIDERGPVAPFRFKDYK